MRKIALITENSREYGRELLKGIADYSQERRNWLLRLLTPAELKSRNPLAGFDGAIARVLDSDTRRRLLAARIPVVDAFCQSPDRAFIGVDSDHEAIARTAAEFFIHRGFRSFAFCGFRRTAFSDARSRAFVQIIRSAGFSCAVYTDPELAGDEINFSEKADLPSHPDPLRAWLTALPAQTAVLCANDLRAYQLLRIAIDSGIRVPQDVVVLGVDNDTLLCSFATPPISSIDPNARGVGYAAARLLNAAMEKPASSKVRPVYHVRPGELVERASTEFHPVDPPWLSEALVYIDRNLSRPIATADIVRIAGLSHTSVEKAFHRIFGESTGNYIMRMKMHEASRLLAKGNITGKEIAVRTGFSSPQYFCRAFRAFYGHAPFARNSEG